MIVNCNDYEQDRVFLNTCDLGFFKIKLCVGIYIWKTLEVGFQSQGDQAIM